MSTSRRNDDDASSSDEELLTSLHDDISVDEDLLGSLLDEKLKEPADKKTELDDANKKDVDDVGDDFEISIDKGNDNDDDDASSDEELLTSALDISIDEGIPEEPKEEEKQQPTTPKKVPSLTTPSRRNLSDDEKEGGRKKVPALKPPSRNNLSDDEGKAPASASPPLRVNVSDDASSDSGNLISPDGSSTIGSQSGTSSPRSGTLSSSNEAGGNREKIRKEVEDLVRRVAPEDIDNIDEMMKQFKGREDELLESLRSMQERKVAQNARIQGQKEAKREAKKTARKKSNLAQERMAAIKAQQEAFSKKGKPRSSPKLKTVGKGTIAAQRMAAIKKQQEAFAKKGRRSSKDTVAPIGGNLAAERMAAIKAQQEAFAQKGTPSRKIDTGAGKGNLAAERMAAIKAQQEAFAKKGTPSRESKAKVGKGNVAAVAMASIQAKQDAFAKKGTKTDDEKSTDSGEPLLDESEKSNLSGSEKGSASPEKSTDDNDQKNSDDGVTSPHTGRGVDDGVTSPNKKPSLTPPRREVSGRNIEKKPSLTPPRREVSGRNIETGSSAKSAAPPSRLNMSITAGSAATIDIEENLEDEILLAPPSASHHSHTDGDDGITGITSAAVPSRLNVSIRGEETQTSGESTSPPSRPIASRPIAPPSRVDVSIRDESPEDKLIKDKALSILPEGDVELDEEEPSQVSREIQTPPRISREIDEDVESGFEIDDKKTRKGDQNESWCKRHRYFVAWLFILGALIIILGVIFGLPKEQTREIQFINPFDKVASILGEGFPHQEDIQLGESLDLSSNGNYLVIGSNEIDSSGSGQVEVVKYNDVNSTWDKVGDIIPGIQGGNFGSSVQINDDGNFVIVGGSGSNDAAIDIRGTVCAYEYDGTEWKKFGSEIRGDFTGDRFGVSLSMAADGSSFIVGADKFRDSITNDLDGYVKVYELQDGDWVQKGETFFGSGESRTGASVAMNEDGNTICIGDRWYKLPNEDPRLRLQKGRARCFEWAGGNWISKGGDIIGTSSAANGQMGSSISLSDDGNRVAVGDRSGGDMEQGSASIFEFKSGEWERMGEELISADGQDRGGMNVKLNSKGNVIVWTAELHSQQKGAVTVSRWNNREWREVDRILGTNETDYFGRSIAVDAEGDRFAASAHGGTADYVNAYALE